MPGRFIRLTGVVGTVLMAGCEYPLGIGRAFLDGDWAYEAATLGDSVLDCSIAGLTLSLDQDGSTVAGVADGGTLVCADPLDPGVVVVNRSLSGSPISGDVRGTRVEFSIGSGDIRHEGEVENRSMTGTVTIRIDQAGAPELDLEGTFVAARPPRD